MKFALKLAPWAALGISAVLGGCIFGDDPVKVDIAKPVVLSPESDFFAASSSRLFSVTEGIVREGKDTTFSARTLELTTIGDTVVGAATLKRVAFTGSPAPASALALLGLNAARLYFDTVNLPDPGPGLRYPDSPYVGWSLDTTVGELRHERVLTKVENVSAAGLVQRCWVFTDKVSWSDQMISTSKIWIGARGVVKQRAEWTSFSPALFMGGTFWRELKALN